MNPYQNIIDTLHPYFLEAGQFDGDEFYCPFCKKMLTCHVSTSLTPCPFWICEDKCRNEDKSRNERRTTFQLFCYGEPSINIYYQKLGQIDGEQEVISIYPPNRIEVRRYDIQNKLAGRWELPFFPLKLNDIDAMIKKISTYLVFS